MNILMLTSEFCPSWGGVGTYVTELVRHLPDDVTIHVVTPKRIQFGDTAVESDQALERIPENICVHYLTTARDTFTHYFYLPLACRRHVPDMVKRYDIDVVHSQNTMPDLLLSPQKLGVPIITTVHSVEDERVSAIQRAAVCSGVRFSDLDRSEKWPVTLARELRLAGRFYYRNSRQYIAVSEWTKAQILRYRGVDPKRIRVIHNGVDSSVFTPNAHHAEERFSDLVDVEGKTVLFLSRMIASKGAHMLMKAVPHILEKVDVHFVFAGPGGVLPVSDNQNNITELGYVDHGVTPSLYELADVFILPSFFENFPLTILEAMATGRPVVASNVGGVSEVIEHQRNGLLIRAGSMRDIVNTITTLISNDELRTDLGRDARRTVEDHFSWKRVAEGVADYYISVLNDDSSNQAATTLRAQSNTDVTQYPPL